MPNKSVVSNLSLRAYDDIFKTDAEREDILREKVMEIPLPDLYDFAIRCATTTR